VRDRLRALADSGVRLTVRPVLASTGAEDHRDRVRLIERLRSLIDQL
jgi:hypothetical protein